MRLQEDLEEWEKLWQMQFQLEKRQIRINHNKRFERENRIQSPRTHTGSSGQWKVPRSDLSWHTKASKALGFLRRNLNECTKEVKRTAYTTLARSIMEYASPAWDP